MVKAVAVLESNRGVSGTVFFSQNDNGPTTVTGNISGLKAGLHGFHVHAFGDTTNGCLSTGPHFNPEGKDHGAPHDENRHVGDLGNLVAGDDGLFSAIPQCFSFSPLSKTLGTATFSIVDKQISLVGPNSVLGRSIVVHADPDDLGRGQTELSLTTGNAGERIGCGVIGLQE
ncbi:superoxide dismutase [Cu-Zn] 1-like isoform X1 [Benincasa hispida]|uniref:superoxide dismutase [Cu-Zn] 1-like isoform X1 n=1 Tax=Benincasa hispida TaxID=102211 RepID=UPI0018FF5F94|nr:superoxide dismutase [Cu-Zn] 1-like isoform X1 [Benincasa hispida]